jgi:protein-disulfide isomerase
MMRSNIAPGGALPDYELPDHTQTIRKLSELQRKGVGGPRVADDVDGADLSGVNGTPSFFINGRRHYGAYDIDTLSQGYAPPAREPCSLRPDPDQGT